jgi:hypothetical protein
MKREQFNTLMSKLCRDAGECNITILGSQALHGQVDELPYIAETSEEVDVAAKVSPWVIGKYAEYSEIHEKTGCYIHFLEEEAVPLPSGWKSRAIHKSMGKTTIIMPAIPDLCAAKLAIGRDKDKIFVNELIERGEVSRYDIRDSVRELPKERIGSALYHLGFQVSLDEDAREGIAP